MTTRRNIFVLSGGGNRGAGQVGMLRALHRAGIRPDVLVGGSVGTINATFVSAHPGQQGLDELAAIWRSMSEESLCGSRRQALLNLARRRPYLFSSDRLRRLVTEWISTHRLEDLPTPVRITTTDIATGRAVHHDTGYLPDLVAASAALPAIFPPVVLHTSDGPTTHIDAGLSEKVPLSGALAIARPGDRIWVLDVTRTPPMHRLLRNPLDVLIASLSASVRNREEPCVPPGVEVVRVKLDEAFDCGPVFDFACTERLFELGEEVAQAAITQVVPAAPAGGLAA